MAWFIYLGAWLAVHFPRRFTRISFIKRKKPGHEIGELNFVCNGSIIFDDSMSR